MRRSVVIGAVVIVVIGVVIILSVPRRNDLPEVQVAMVARRATLEAKVTANGEVCPPRFISLQSKVTGRVTDVFVKEGDLFKKGKPLVRVDPTQLASATSIQEAALRVAQAEVQNQTEHIAAGESARGDDQNQ